MKFYIIDACMRHKMIQYLSPGLDGSPSYDKYLWMDLINLKPIEEDELCGKI